MALVKCEHGHYFDDRRFDYCPYCRELETSDGDENSIGEMKTQYKPKLIENDEGSLTEFYGENVGEEEKTISIFSLRENNLLTAGWLVCVEGPEKGKSYAIFPGRNFAGRSDYMDIVFYDDREISRDRHFSVVYDPKSGKFFAVEGGGMTYINGELICGQREIFENDMLEAGKSSFCFVPFCKGDRIWK